MGLNYISVLPRFGDHLSPAVSSCGNLMSAFLSQLNQLPVSVNIHLVVGGFLVAWHHRLMNYATGWVCATYPALTRK